MSILLCYVIVAKRDDGSRWYLALEEDVGDGREYFTKRHLGAQIYGSEEDAALEISKRNTSRFWRLASGADRAHPARGVEVGVERIAAEPVGIKLARRYTYPGGNPNAFTW
jgi:hypothetical protein